MYSNIIVKRLVKMKSKPNINNVTIELYDIFRIVLYIYIIKLYENNINYYK